MLLATPTSKRKRWSGRSMSMVMTTRCANTWGICRCMVATLMATSKIAMARKGFWCISHRASNAAAYHETNQFQVFVDGSGMMGKRG